MSSSPTFLAFRFVYFCTFALSGYLFSFDTPSQSVLLHLRDRIIRCWLLFHNSSLCYVPLTSPILLHISFFYLDALLGLVRLSNLGAPAVTSTHISSSHPPLCYTNSTPDQRFIGQQNSLLSVLERPFHSKCFMPPSDNVSPLLSFIQPDRPSGSWYILFKPKNTGLISSGG